MIRRDPAPVAAKIPRGVWVLGFVSLLMDVSSEMIHSLLPIFMVTGLGASALVVGSVGRMAEVKDYPCLVAAFLTILRKQPDARKRLRLLIVGDGNSRQACVSMLRKAGAETLAWLPGERSDIPDPASGHD